MAMGIRLLMNHKIIKNMISIYKNLLKNYNIRKLFIIHITGEKYHFIECEDILDKIKLKDIINDYYKLTNQ